MARYYTFSRTWWRDRAQTIPGAGRRYWTGHSFETQEEAREFCRNANLMQFGAKMRGPRGQAYEYTSDRR